MIYLSSTTYPLGLPYPLAADGDSICYGYGLSSPTTQRYSSILPFVGERQNTGISGQRLDQMTALWPAGIGLTCRSQAVPPILIVEGGYNDLLQGDPNSPVGDYNPATGTNAAGAYVRLQAYIAQARASGVTKIMMLTLLSVAVGTTYYTPYLVLQIAMLNALITGTPGLFDAIADIGAITTMVERQADGLHPDAAGHQTIANTIAASFSPLLPILT